jgi:uncharacterized OsmC-like protein
MTPITTVVRDGVDTAKLFATLDPVDGGPDPTQFRFRAHNRWIPGLRSEATIHDYFSLGEQGADDNEPAPVGYVVHALASSLTAGLVNIAAARGVELVEVTSTVEGDINVNRILGLDPLVRNGFEQVRVHFAVKGNAPQEMLRDIVEQTQARAAVFDVITNGVATSVVVDP